MATHTQHPTAMEQILDASALPSYNFGFANHLKKEYNFDPAPSKPICQAHEEGHCALGEQCPDKHPTKTNYNSMMCKHWLRALCKKGNTCEFLHEYNLRQMQECPVFARYGACTNGYDCLFIHIDPERKEAPCQHYERGFCPLGPHCAGRHERQKPLCKYYLAGFCPDGKHCKAGSHPVWKEKGDLKKPVPKRIYTVEEIEAEKLRRSEKLEKDREEEEEKMIERGVQRREFGRGRGRGRPWIPRGRGRGER